MNIKDIVAARLKKYEGMPRGNPEFDDNEIKRRNLEAAEVCIADNCDGRKQNPLGMGTEMVYCYAHDYKFMVKGAMSGEGITAVGDMTELYK